ncbi:fructose-6-phosphate aldolase [Candidatus Woesearchaeota archaeon]|nr:fructose-6-phosphate aldolase [Candidatus Woesearchaeota archaeon]
MEIFIDTANIDEIKQANDWGILDGVTTNPSLVAKEKDKGKDFKAIVKEICEIVHGDVSAEVVAVKYEDMLHEARILAKIHKNVVVKIPLTPDGLKAVKALAKEGIRANVTLCFSANQALLAAKAGAYIISPFVGRLDDIGQDGVQLVEEIRQIYDNYDFKTKILFASVRHADHVKQAALLGADIATIPFKVLEQLYRHPLTDVGLKQFLDDWAKLGQQIK